MSLLINSALVEQQKYYTETSFRKTARFMGPTVGPRQQWTHTMWDNYRLD